MSNYLNDSPIESADDDKFGFQSFAKMIAKSFQKIWLSLQVIFVHIMFFVRSEG